MYPLNRYWFYTYWYLLFHRSVWRVCWLLTSCNHTDGNSPIHSQTVNTDRLHMASPSGLGFWSVVWLLTHPDLSQGFDPWPLGRWTPGMWKVLKFKSASARSLMRSQNGTSCGLSHFRFMSEYEGFAASSLSCGGYTHHDVSIRDTKINYFILSPIFADAQHSVHETKICLGLVPFRVAPWSHILSLQD